MKKQVVFIFSILVLMMASPLNAATWTPPVDIQTVYAHLGHGGYGLYEISDVSVNPDNCNSTWYGVSKQNNAMFNEIYSLMLAAHMSGKKVQLYINGCSPHNYPEIQHARIVK